MLRLQKNHRARQLRVVVRDLGRRAEAAGWHALPAELQQAILLCLSLPQLQLVKAVSRAMASSCRAVLRSQAWQNMGANRCALEKAKKAYERDILILQAEDAASDPDFGGGGDAMFWGPAQEAAFDEYEEFIEDCVRQAQQAEEDELDLPDDEYLERGRPY